MVSTKMVSNSVYSKAAHWETQGLNPGFNFFLCLREKGSFSFLFSFIFFIFLFFLFFYFLFFIFLFYFLFVQRGAKLSQEKKKEEKGRKACNGRGPIRTCEEHIGKNKVWYVRILSWRNDIFQTLWFPPSPLVLHFGSLP